MAKSPTISHKRERSRAINTENENTFVFKLYDILKHNPHEPLHWSEDGTEVVITSAKEVAERVVSKYFKTSDFKSFTRQLHLYGFSRSTDGRKDKTLGGRCKFFHRHFRRNNPELLHMITRVSKPKEHTASKNMSAGQQFTTGTFRLKPVPKEKTGMQAAIVLNKTTSPWTSISPLNDISTPKNSMMPVSPVVYIAPAPTLAPASNADQTLHNFQQCIHPTSVVTTVSMPTNHISMQKQTVGEPRMQKAHSVLSALQILSDNIVFLDQNSLSYVKGQLKTVGDTVDRLSAKLAPPKSAPVSQSLASSYGWKYQECNQSQYPLPPITNAEGQVRFPPLFPNIMDGIQPAAGKHPPIAGYQPGPPHGLQKPAKQIPISESATLCRAATTGWPIASSSLARFPDYQRAGKRTKKAHTQPIQPRITLTDNLSHLTSNKSIRQQARIPSSAGLTLDIKPEAKNIELGYNPDSPLDALNNPQMPHTLPGTLAPLITSFDGISPTTCLPLATNEAISAFSATMPFANSGLQPMSTNQEILAGKQPVVTYPQLSFQSLSPSTTTTFGLNNSIPMDMLSSPPSNITNVLSGIPEMPLIGNTMTPNIVVSNDILTGTSTNMSIDWQSNDASSNNGTTLAHSVPLLQNTRLGEHYQPLPQ